MSQKNMKKFRTKLNISLNKKNGNTDIYDKRYMKIRFSSDDHLPIGKTLKMYLQ